MKNILLTIYCSACLCLTGFSQTIPGAQIDSCHKAFQLIPSSGITFKGFGFKNHNLPNVFLPLCQDSTSSYQSWFKFTTSSTAVNSIFRFVMQNAGYRIQLYTNLCSNLTEVGCFKMESIPQVAYSYSPFISLLQNTEYKIKISYWDGFPPAEIAIQYIPNSRKVRSTTTGGLWNQTTTWQGGRVPIDGDSVYITDGSSVTVNLQTTGLPPNLAYLKVGGEASSKARLVINSTFSWQFTGDVYIGQGDTLRDMATSAGNMDFNFEKNLTVDGVVKVVTSRFTFLGTGRQTLGGAGNIWSSNTYFYIDKPSDTLHSQLGLSLSALVLTRGVFNNIKPVSFINGYDAFALDSTKGSIRRILGKMTRKPDYGRNIPIKSNLNFFLLDYSRSAIEPNDSSISIDSEYVRSTRPINLRLAKTPGTALIHKGNLHTANSPFYNPLNAGGTLKLRAKDTLIVNFDVDNLDTTQLSWMPISMEPSYLETDPKWYLDSAITQIDSSFNIVPGGNTMFKQRIILGRGTKVRPFVIQGRWPTGSRAGGFKAWIELVDRSPGGPVNAPLTFVGGNSLIKLTANQPLPPSAQIGYWYFVKDQLIGNNADVRIAQAPTPDGPWTMVSRQPAILPAAALGNTPSGRLSNSGINLANGNYFTIATVSSFIDAQIVDFVAPYKWESGCGNASRMGLIVRNNGVYPITQLGYKVKNVSTGEEISGLAQLGTPTLATKSDTLWIENGPVVNSLPNQTLRFKLLLNGDGNSTNDSLQKTIQYSPLSLPYQEQFTTGTLFYKQGEFGDEINLPTGWWADAEFLIGNPFQSWNSVIFSGQGFLQAFREPNIVSPLSAHSPHIGLSQGTFELRYTYRWRSVTSSGNQPRPRLEDTLRISYSTDCGATYTTIDEIRRDNHPNPGTESWISRSAVFSKTDVNPAFLQIKLWKPVGSGGLTIDVDSIRISQITTSNQMQVAQARNVLVFPNPSGGNFNLSLPGSGGHFRLIDIQGKEVWMQALPADQTKVEINLQGKLPKGLYFLQWKNENLTGQGKVLVE